MELVICGYLFKGVGGGNWLILWRKIKPNHSNILKMTGENGGRALWHSGKTFKNIKQTKKMNDFDHIKVKDIYSTNNTMGTFTGHTRNWKRLF